MPKCGEKFCYQTARVVGTFKFNTNAHLKVEIAQEERGRVVQHHFDSHSHRTVHNRTWESARRVAASARSKFEISIVFVAEMRPPGVRELCRRRGCPTSSGFRLRHVTERFSACNSCVDGCTVFLLMYPASRIWGHLDLRCDGACRQLWRHLNLLVGSAVRHGVHSGTTPTLRLFLDDQ